MSGATRRIAEDRVLLLNVLVVAACALVYELLCGTVASYLFGNAVLQFSLVLGTYLFAMGIGAWASKAFEPRAASRYVEIELALALVGGLSVPLLFVADSLNVPVRPTLYLLVFLVGSLVGLELPLLVRILRDRPTGARFGDVVARALAYDYVGALAASVLFPLFLAPHLGLVRTAALTGSVNIACAISATFVVPVARPNLARGVGLGILAVLGVAFTRADAWVAATTD